MEDKNYAPEFEQRLGASGLKIPAWQKAEMADAYFHILKMLDRLPDDFGFGDEPAAAFDAAQMPAEE